MMIYSITLFGNREMNAKLCILLCTILSPMETQNQQFSLDDLISQVFTQRTTNVETTTQSFRPEPTKTTILNPDSRSGGGGDDAETTQKYKSCGFNKECVPRHLCKNGTISTTGEGFIDIRIAGEDCIYNEICCDIPSKTVKPIIPALPREPHEGCGWRNLDGVGFKIANKIDEAEFGEFPWMAAVLKIEEDGGYNTIHLYECGGSLISPDVILTAAHCVVNRKPEELVVRAGEWDTQNTNEILPFVDKPVREIIVHENYHKGALHNDIALLIVKDPFTWEENIRPICLPPPNTNFDNLNCLATGWGKDTFGREGKYQVILKKIELPIVPHEKCQRQLRQTRLGFYYQLHDSFICAGGQKGKDTCKGDGGSPLVCPIPGYKNRYYQSGIVAWGIACAEENVPGVYADVAYLRQWISDKLIARGINFDHFTP